MTTATRTFNYPLCEGCNAPIPGPYFEVWGGIAYVNEAAPFFVRPGAWEPKCLAAKVANPPGAWTVREGVPPLVAPCMQHRYRIIVKGQPLRGGLHCVDCGKVDWTRTLPEDGVLLR